MSYSVVVLFAAASDPSATVRSLAAKEQLEVLNQQYSDLSLQSQSYDQNIASLKDWKEKNGEETKKLFPLSDAERIDRFLTFVMNEVGVTVDGLNIGQTMQYYIDGEGNLVTASPDEVAGTTDSSASGNRLLRTAAQVTAAQVMAAVLHIPPPVILLTLPIRWKAPIRT